MVSHLWPITAISNVFAPTVKIMSLTESHTQCYPIKSKDGKNKSIKMLRGSSHPNRFLKIKVSQKMQNLWKSETGSQELSWAPLTKPPFTAILLEQKISFLRKVFNTDFFHVSNMVTCEALVYLFNNTKEAKNR